MKKLFSAILILSLTACSNHAQTEFPLGGGSRSVEKRIMPFDSVSVEGPFDIELIQVPDQASFYLNGNNSLIDQSIYLVKDHVLHFFMNKEYSYPDEVRMHLTVLTPNLRRLHYNGPGDVKLSPLKADHLTLIAEGKAKIYTCGSATRFDITLSGTAHLNAKCLYANTIYVNTSDTAVAEVTNSGSLGAFASGNSDIYYYDNPKAVTHIEYKSGSVIRMTGLAAPRTDKRGVLPHPPILIQGSNATMATTK